MEREELAPHVDEIARVLGEKADKSKIAEELEKYVNLYRVSLEWAKRDILKKMGGNPDSVGDGSGRKSVAELKEIVAFYSTPTGKKLVGELPKVAEATLYKIREIGDKISAEVASRLREEMKKRGFAI